MDYLDILQELNQKISELLEKRLSADLSNTWDDSLSEAYSKSIASEVALFSHQFRSDYKYFVTCIISKKNQVDPKISSSVQCELDKDFCARISKETPFLNCVVNIFASYSRS